jgi:hypothetical protein
VVEFKQAIEGSKIMSDAASRSLRELIAEHGLELADDSRRLEAFLRDYCPESRREIFALVAASRAGIPARLRSQARESGLGLAAATFAKHLEDDYGLSADLAKWAVNAWALALGVEADLESGPPPIYTKTPGDFAADEATMRQPGKPQGQVPSATAKVRPADPMTTGVAAVVARQPVTPPPPRRTRRTWLLIVAGIVAFLVALAAGTLYGRADSKSPGADSQTTLTTVASADQSSATTTTFVPTTITLMTSTSAQASLKSTSSTAKLAAAGTTSGTLPTTPTSVLGSTQRITCTLYGATVEIPAGWSVTGLYTAFAGGKTFLALGPNGCQIRIDTILKDEGTDLWNSCALWQQGELKKTHTDYHLESMEWTTFAGVPAVEWHYGFLVRDRGPSEYRTIYLNPNSTGIVARMITDAPEPTKAATLAIQNSFQLPPQ